MILSIYSAQEISVLSLSVSDHGASWPIARPPGLLAGFGGWQNPQIRLTTAHLGSTHRRDEPFSP
jgi:hypothetical protein